ncbi:hypothetical protein EV421DRAFT_1745209 [Armillaria borealis]|uniref:Uncharacterized protein n=1 Tax=Armillaria borealis TaxID=47425 RepID=A0AA39MDG7_9AGAR|nr:hypothetical protein EV421DRAFT_1745209 [Armillaria borealis]
MYNIETVLALVLETMNTEDRRDTRRGRTCCEISPIPIVQRSHMRRTNNHTARRFSTPFLETRMSSCKRPKAGGQEQRNAGTEKPNRRNTPLEQRGSRSGSRHYHRNASDQKPLRRNMEQSSSPPPKPKQQETKPAAAGEDLATITGTQAAKKPLRRSTPLENSAAAEANLLTTTKTEATRNQTVATRSQKQRGGRSGPRHCHRNASDKIPLRRNTPLENSAAAGAILVTTTETKATGNDSREGNKRMGKFHERCECRGIWKCQYNLKQNGVVVLLPVQGPKYL